MLDGTREVPVVGRHELAPLASGKHTVELSAAGYETHFATVLIAPGHTSTLSGELVPVIVPLDPK